MNRTTLSACLGVLAATILLAACGGGGGGGDNAPATTAAVAPIDSQTAVRLSGTVTGFGSVIIMGVRYDDQSASVQIDNNPAAPTGGSLSDLKLGMQVEASAKAGALGAVTVRAALLGPVGTVNAAASSFTVFQQTVLVTGTGATPTVFEGLSGLADLAAGDRVEVHGSLDANKQLVATRVERRARTDSAGGVRIGGKVASLNASAKTFMLGDLSVNYAGATLLPGGATLADGQRVAVYSDTVPGAGAPLVAKAVKVAEIDEGSALGVGGRISAYTSAADFTVDGVKVDASGASFEGGSAADLAVGVAVAVEGRVVAGVLKASKAKVLKTSLDVKVSLSGAVTDYVSATSFKVRGQVVDASSAAFSGGSAADLGNGANVKVSGLVKGELVKAESVEFTVPVDTGTVKLLGEIRDFDATARRFHFLGVSLQLSNSTELVGGSSAELVNGRRVEVTGTPAAPAAGSSTIAERVLNVSKLSFLPALAPQASVVTGRVSGLVGNSFKLPGVTVTLADGTQYSGGVRGDLANGIEVLVTGLWNAQQQALVAGKVEIRKPEDRPTGVAVAGAISDYTSKASFRIGQQKVDASEATLDGGAETDLANGRHVEGVGVIAGPEGGRYLKLSKLRFLK